jgi:hypothetical protein
MSGSPSGSAISLQLSAKSVADGVAIKEAVMIGAIEAAFANLLFGKAIVAFEDKAELDNSVFDGIEYILRHVVFAELLRFARIVVILVVILVGVRGRADAAGSGGALILARGRANRSRSIRFGT